MLNLRILVNLIKTNMKNATAHQKRKIVEYLESRGYINRDGYEYRLYLDGRLNGEWERNICVTIISQWDHKYYIVVEILMFQRVGDLRDIVRIQRNVTCVEDIQFMENSMDKLLEVREYFFGSHAGNVNN